MNNYNNKTQFPVVDPLTGEYMMLLKTKKQFNTTNDKFIKFFIPLIDKLHLLTNSEIIIIQYISKNIGINKNKIVINQEKTGLKKSVFYKAISGLIKHEIIQKTDYQNIYLISKNYLKNGR